MHLHYVVDTCFLLGSNARVLRCLEKGFAEGQRGPSCAAVEYDILDCDLFTISGEICVFQ